MSAAVDDSEGADPGDGLEQLLADACRVLAETGLTPNVLGHVSLRMPDGGLLVRCRGPREAGLAFTTADDIRPVDRDGRRAADGWNAPNELPIHTAVLRARPDVSVVLHAHPPAVVATTLARLELRPIVGAYDISAARLAQAGVPTWPRAVLVNTDALGDALAVALGSAPALRLYGHGLVTVGRGEPLVAIAEAVVNAVAIDTLARTTLAVLAAGAEPVPIDEADLAQLPDLGPGLNLLTMWRHLLARTDAAAR